MQRFSRTERFLGKEHFQRLQEAKVTIVGLGAVGGHVVEGLARAGVCHLRVVDFDTIQASNINRQILATEATLGQTKTEAARERILAIHPRCRVKDMQLFVREETLAQVLEPKPDLLIDAIDSLNPKVQLLTAAYEQQIPTLSSMGAALRSDPRQIYIGDIMQTRNCPLAKRVRKRLRANGVGLGIGCVYSTEPVTFAYQEPESPDPGEQRFPGEGGRTRRTLGSLPTITGIFGLMLANTALAYLSGLEEQLFVP